jgi:beta-lactamase superfamily II metal-dependent hydrolase
LDFAEDYTPSNGSSISFIMEYKNYKFLFLGDSHPSVIVENLKKQYFGKQFPIKFDLIKVSHHGSIGNTSKQLLSLIDSEKYIFSTNGKISNHPDIETIARIISRKVDFKRTLYFNYPLDIHKQINTTEVMNKYNFENIINDGNSPSEIQFE